jgi:site-specific recombinase XerD
LSGHTLTCYLRSLKCFTNWCLAENLLPGDPFDGVKIPKPPKKVIPAFSEAQLAALLAATEPQTPRGFRDYTIILTLLDTGLRISELCTLKMGDVQIEDGILKVLGKGNRERQVPFGREVQKLLWRYLSLSRPEPAHPQTVNVFLTMDGKPLNKNSFGAIMHALGEKAGLAGIRCSPHSLRHTAAISFLRNGGDAFSLQRLLGHSSLEMTRAYCQIADVDLTKAHRQASPVDNLGVLDAGRFFRHSAKSGVPKGPKSPGR